eukprot:CAMPEP_0206428964 /NCGR_PEP_ID=MMETSP0324_2-20121206/5964_1 /ASSEMBLY_ACC=CAM_ASM_000836 /TAXON_ID=2866 /ORGANISM="Crypthecodinium cohnii, Strain Seligo" /LENGTH=213 /DNA_ID=CAMNT_0053894565 /DNA_START=472 /DNA_END=1113 /DNA_ORIENTATION=-
MAAPQQTSGRIAAAFSEVKSASLREPHSGQANKSKDLSQCITRDLHAVQPLESGSDPLSHFLHRCFFGQSARIDIIRSLHLQTVELHPKLPRLHLKTREERSIQATSSPKVTRRAAERLWFLEELRVFLAATRPPVRFPRAAGALLCIGSFGASSSNEGPDSKTPLLVPLSNVGWRGTASCASTSAATFNGDACSKTELRLVEQPIEREMGIA